MGRLEFDGYWFSIPVGKTADALRLELERFKAAGLLDSMIGLLQAEKMAEPPAVVASIPQPMPQSDSSSLKRKQSRPGIEANLLLYDVLLDAFNAQGWQDLKPRYQRDDAGNVVLHLLQNTLLEGDALRQCADAVDEYAGHIQKALPDFAYTDYQFFAVLFTELFFTCRSELMVRMAVKAENYPMLRLYAGSLPTTPTAIGDWLPTWMQHWGVNALTKQGGLTKSFAKKLDDLLHDLNGNAEPTTTLAAKFNALPVTDYLAGLNRLAFYMATGSGKTHLLHLNLLQAERHLPELLGLEVGSRLNFYVLVPNADLAAQHERELRRFFPNRNIQRVDDENDKTVTESVMRVLENRQVDVRVLTVHQLAAVTERITGQHGNLFTNPFGNSNVVFADEGHKGSSSDAGWRADRNRLMGEQGFCFEYSATFSQSIKPDNTALLQEYAKAIVFDYPYRLFYRDGYGKKPAFFPEVDAGAVARAILSGGKDKADLVALTAEQRWQLFVEQLQRFHDQYREFHANAGDATYREHRFASPLMLMMCQRVDDSGANPSNVREVIELLRRFLANAGNESAQLLEGGTARFSQLVQDLFHAPAHQPQVRLACHQLNDGEIGLRIPGCRWFGAVYVGKVESVGVALEAERLTGSLMTQFFEQGDNPDIQMVIAARKLIEGWNTHRISSLGLVELGKARGSLVVQLFGRGVRLAGTPQNRLQRTGKFPTSERFDVFGYEAAYLKTFIEEAEAADIVTEHTLAIKIALKPHLLQNKWIPQATQTLENSSAAMVLQADEVFHKACHRGQTALDNTVSFNPLPFLDRTQLYQAVWARLPAVNVVMDWDNFQACAQLALQRCQLPYGASMKDADFLLRWARNRLLQVIQTWYRLHSQAYAFAHAELVPLDVEQSRNLNFAHYTLSGSAAMIARIAEDLRLVDGFIPESRFDQPLVQGNRFPAPSKSSFPAPVVRLLAVGSEKHEEDRRFALQALPHAFDPLLIKLEGVEDVLISPDRLEKTEAEWVARLHQYVSQHPDTHVALLRNQKEWGFLGFYPDFVLWLKRDGLEHIAFLDPKGLTLHNTEDVVSKLLFSLMLDALEQRVVAEHPHIRLSSFILLNHPLSYYLNNSSQRVLLTEACNRLLQQHLLGSADTAPVQWSEDELQKILQALNAREISQHSSDLLDDIVNDDHLLRKEQLTDYLQRSIPADTQTQLKQFWDKAETAEKTGCLEQYLLEQGISAHCNSIQLAFLAYINRLIFGEEKYQAFIAQLEDADRQNLKTQMKDWGRDELLSGFLGEALSAFLPGAKIVVGVAKYWWQHRKK